MGKQSAINVQPLNMYAPRCYSAMHVRRSGANISGVSNTLSLSLARPNGAQHPHQSLFPRPVGTAAWLALPYLHVISRLFVQVGNSAAHPRVTAVLAIFQRKSICNWTKTLLQECARFCPVLHKNFELNLPLARNQRKKRMKKITKCKLYNLYEM